MHLSNIEADSVETQVIKFSETMEQESLYANQDERIIAIRNENGLSTIVEGGNSNLSRATTQTKNWITNFLIDPPLYAPAEHSTVAKN